LSRAGHGSQTLEIQVQGRPKYVKRRSDALAALDQAPTLAGLSVSEQKTPGPPSMKFG
jgi:hypothetical protein